LIFINICAVFYRIVCNSFCDNNKRIFTPSYFSFFFFVFSFQEKNGGKNINRRKRQAGEILLIFK